MLISNLNERVVEDVADLCEFFFPRVARWNLLRGFLDERVYGPIPDGLWIQEELIEFYEALKKGDTAHALQEFCDVLFVYLGGMAKLNAYGGVADDTLNFSSRSTPSLLQAYALLQDAYGWLINEECDGSFFDLVFSAFGLVCTANESKPTAKANGKVVKGDNYVSPLAAIAKLELDYSCK